jgi:aminobenzoyl-glutamate utilization protein B
VGIPTTLAPLRPPVPDEDRSGGGSNDFGHIMHVVPAIRLTFPGNLPNLPGHNWANAVTMATPIAHKGATAGAKAAALTVIDLVTTPRIVSDAWDYFKNVQMKDLEYEPFIGKDDKPATWANRAVMDRYRPEMRKHFYDPTRYATYLDQLGVKYPTVR